MQINGLNRLLGVDFKFSGQRTVFVDLRYNRNIFTPSGKCIFAVDFII